MNRSQALGRFWSSFGIPAYDQYTVPDEAEMPYITYSSSEAEFGYAVPLTASVWYQSYSWEDITLKTYEIFKKISPGGTLLNTDDGKIWIYRGSPFSTRMSDVKDDVRRMLINVTAEYFTSE